MNASHGTPNAEKLHQMPYSELKKLAKKHGIKRNMKAEKIIKSLMSVSSEDVASFTTPLQTRINSSKKNKENKFDEDNMTPLGTPRRGTYTIDSPSECFLAATPRTEATPLKSAVNGFKKTRKSGAIPLTSPATEDFVKAKSGLDSVPLKSPASNVLNSKSKLVATPLKSDSTIKAKSLPNATPLKSLAVADSVQNKSKLNDTPFESQSVNGKRKLDAVSFESSTTDGFSEEMFNVTMCRGSERKLRPRKVSFVTPKKTPQSPKYISLKDRPKTPIASRLSYSKRVSFSTPVGHQQRKSIEKTIRVTPHPHSLRDSNGSSKKNPLHEEKSSKGKRVQTPNFKKIHQKAFDKMESIDDYQKRKVLHSAKKLKESSVKVKANKPKNSKIPVPFCGIPFIPSVTSTTGMNFDFGSRTTKSAAASKNKVVSQPKIKSIPAKAEDKPKITVSEENITRKGKAKFDLKASLSRKLGYRPYTGHVKPLSEMNTSSLSAPSCVHNMKENQIKLVENRTKTRALLKGVRTNKRFELLMKNRNLQ